MDVVAVKVGIPGGIGDLHGLHTGEHLGHALGVLLNGALGVEAQHGGNALRNGLAGNDHHLLLGEGTHLLGSHDDVLVVGQHKNGESGG